MIETIERGSIERGSIEHLRLIKDAHEDTLRMVNNVAENMRKAIESGDLEMALADLDVIETFTRGYGK